MIRKTKLTKLLQNKFGGVVFRKDTMFFEYNSGIYKISSITSEGITYGNKGEHLLRSDASFFLHEVKLRKSVVGLRCVFTVGDYPLS